ncbi:hypothetical protein HDU91_001445 [Kappamyces sp. JEL0680]|nr:hypothetical protein HDU91_001445 [Kappamyces sp. JEL0680]
MPLDALSDSNLLGKPAAKPRLFSFSSEKILSRPEPAREESEDAVLLSKYRSKVQVLEKCIDHLQSDHANSLRGLHAEIERLSSMVSGPSGGVQALQKTHSVSLYRNDAAEFKSESSVGLLKKLEEPAVPASALSPVPAPALSLVPTPAVECKDECVQTDPVAVQPRPPVAKPTSKPKLLVDDSTETDLPLPLVTVETQTAQETVAKVPVAEPPVQSKPEAVPKAPAEAAPATHDESLYFLVQKEKKKFHAMVERNAEEKKRRAAEMDSLRQETQILKGVLKLAGLEYNLQDFREIIQAHDGKRMMTPVTVIKNKDLRGEKNSVLPPIPHDGQDRGSEDEFEADVHATIKELQDAGIGSSKPFDDPEMPQQMAPPYVPPPTTTARKPRFKPASPGSLEPADGLATQPRTIPAILQHNQNLDYNGRAHIYLDNVVFEETEETLGTASTVGEKSSQLSRLFAKSLGRDKDAASSTTATLPPLKDDVLGTKKTSYASRLWKSRVVRSKIMKGLENKF